MRWLAALAVLLTASVCEAKVLIVAGKALNADAAQVQQESELCGKAIMTILDQYGRSGSRLIGVQSTKTVFCGTGVQVWNYGSTGASTESFDGVIHVGTLDRSTGARPNAAYRADSLTLGGATRPTVPQLFVVSMPALLARNFHYATNCSTGMTSTAVSGSGAPQHDMERSYYRPGTSRLFVCTANLNLGSARVAAGSELTSRGFVRQIAYAQNVLGKMQYVGHGYGTHSGWKDSVSFKATPDTLQMWKVNNSHASDGKPCIYTIALSGAAAYEPGNGIIDLPLLLAGLAALDSATGGQVFDPAKLPIQMSFIIDGIARRNKAYSAGGPDPSDTTFTYTAFDSIHALGVPVTFAFNVDSVSVYLNDLVHAKAVTRARFVPSNRAGLDSTAAMNDGSAKWQQPRSVWGRYRNRQAMGGDGLAAGDTALSVMLRAQFYKADSIFGVSRVSHIGYAPDDDWTPFSIRAQQSGLTVDSVLYAARQAGLSAIVSNLAWKSWKPGGVPTNPRGYDLGGQRSVNGINILGHNGYSTFGSSALLGATTDSVDFGAADPGPGSFYYEIRRAWLGACGIIGEDQFDGPTGIGLQAPIYSMNAFYAGEDSISVGTQLSGARSVQYRKGSIIKMHLSDFGSGSGQDRPGWWSFKSIVNAARTINEFAGRTIVDIVYPEDIKP